MILLDPPIEYFYRAYYLHLKHRVPVTLKLGSRTIPLEDMRSILLEGSGDLPPQRWLSWWPGLWRLLRGSHSHAAAEISELSAQPSAGELSEQQCSSPKGSSPVSRLKTGLKTTISRSLPPRRASSQAEELRPRIRALRRRRLLLEQKRIELCAQVEACRLALRASMHVPGEATESSLAQGQPDSVQPTCNTSSVIS